MNYYNDTDPHAISRLRSLISAGLIPPGHVDSRSIADVQPTDLAGFTQCHFFAGIGGWPEALRLAGVSPDMPLWTGSCPCQPFSSAGQRKGTADERHLWPVFCDLIAQCGPPVVFGEQVASADGRDWLACVRSEMEALGYAVGAADLCAAGVGAPHIRQRLYFVGLSYAYRERRQGLHPLQRADDAGWNAGNPPETSGSRQSGGMADAGRPCGEWRENTGGSDSTQAPQRVESASHDQPCSCDGDTHEADSFWGSADWLWCRDGKWRPVEPGTFPLAHGVSGRVALLRGYGNAIVPQVAAAFIRAALTA